MKLIIQEHCDIDNDMINSYKWIFEQIKENDRIPEKVYAILNDVIKLTGNEDIRLLVKGVSKYGAVFSTIEYKLPEGFDYVEPVTYEDKYDTLKSLMDSGMLSDMLSETGGALMDLTVDYVCESELRLTIIYKTDAQSEVAKKSAETYAKLFSSKIREVVEGKYDGEFKLTTVLVDNNGSVFYQGEY